MESLLLQRQNRCLKHDPPIRRQPWTKEFAEGRAAHVDHELKDAAGALTYVEPSRGGSDGPGVEKTPSDLLRAEDGIRTRDPHLGKVVLLVWVVDPSPPPYGFCPPSFHLVH